LKYFCKRYKRNKKTEKEKEEKKTKENKKRALGTNFGPVAKQVRGPS
jgi:hypothetical protein